jgi:competence protein ComGC
VLGSVLFLMMQIIALISLILSIAVPLCSKQSDCDQDNGWVCVSTQEGKSRSFCVDCRVPTCSNNPEVPFNVSAVRADGMLASDYCKANIDSFLYEGECCYLLKSALSTMTIGAPSPNSTPTYNSKYARKCAYHTISCSVVACGTAGDDGPWAFADDGKAPGSPSQPTAEGRTWDQER